MAKAKLDWFKLDCQTDDKMELVESEYGIVGFGVVIKLFQKIYGGEGYYCDWNDDTALLFARKIGMKADAVSEIVGCAVRRGIFDKRIFEQYGVLTSHGIQVRYFEVTGRRKLKNFKSEYLLDECAHFSESADISSKNVDILSENVCNSKQNREEKNRVDEIRERREKTAPKVAAGKPQKRFTPPSLEEVRNYCKERGNGINAEAFVSYYRSKGWKVGKTQMKDWQAAVRTWEQRERERSSGGSEQAERSYDLDKWVEDTRGETDYSDLKLWD